VKVPLRPPSSNTQFAWNTIHEDVPAFQGVEIHSKEKTHSARKRSQRVPEAQIRRAGRWHTDAMTGAYLSYLPLSFMRSITGFPKEGKGYFLSPRAGGAEESLSSKAWSEADIWLQRMESYHPDKADNKVVRLDLAGSGSPPPSRASDHPAAGFSRPMSGK
jgi:centromere DNA-binding complex CBF3 subunit-like protein